MTPTISWLKEQLCRKLSNKEGFATIWYLVAVVVIVFMASFVISESYAETQQNRVKTTMDRAVKAAVMQYRKDKLQNDAEIVFNQTKADEAFTEILRKNLNLDASLRPNDDSILSGAKEINLVYKRYYDNETASFPQTVENEGIRLKHTFNNPGMAAVLKVVLPDEWGKGDTTYYVPAVAEVNLDIDKGGAG